MNFVTVNVGIDIDQENKLPPKEALDLYAFAVEYCEEHGYSPDRIRVRWTVPDPIVATPDPIGDEEDRPTSTTHFFPFYERDGSYSWHCIGHYVEEPLKLPYSEGVSLHLEDVHEVPENSLLCNIKDNLTLRIIPKHRWVLRETPTLYVNTNRMKVFLKCVDCKEEGTWEYTTSDNYINETFLQPPPEEGHIPVCIKRHSPIVVENLVENQLVNTELKVLCALCGDYLPIPEDLIEWIRIKRNRLPRSHEFYRRGPDYTEYNFTSQYEKSLSRCPGGSNATINERLGNTPR